MKTYHKIQTVFFRDQENNNKTLLEGVWSKPEFEALQDIKWSCSEKIDGTNIRILWDGENIEFRGKTDNAQVPKHLMEYLITTFKVEDIKSIFKDLETGSTVCLYGEGYGKKIQKGGNYLPDSVDFILFDIKIGSWWLSRKANEDIADYLNIKIVPIIGIFTLSEAVEYVRRGFKSTISDNKDYIAEGFICKPEVELTNRKGERVITKIKYKDFPKK